MTARTPIGTRSDLSPLERALQSAVSGLAGGEGLALSVAGSRLVGLHGARGALDLSAGMARALVGGTPVTCRGALTGWTLVGRSQPFPWVLAVRGTLKNLDDATPALRSLTATHLPALANEDPFLAIQSASPSLREMLDELRRIAGVPIPVLLLGETGTGKEVIARAVHRASRRPGRFVAENCAALPDGLLESELFGVKRGAFTGADRDRLGRMLAAHEGTLFLDEIGDLPASLQVKLLRILQEKEVRALGAARAVPVDARVVAATHRPLRELADSGAFRSDLYFRLAGFTADLPPLRARPADLPALCAFLLARLHGEGIGPGRFLSPPALTALARREFPGNVRELDNVLRRASALSPGPVIRAELVELSESSGPAGNLEVRMIRQALEQSRGVKSAAARSLGWSRQKLYRRLERLKISSEN